VRLGVHTTCLAFSAGKPRWMESINEGFMKDIKTKQLLTNLSVQGQNDQGFSLVDGIIMHKGKISLGSHTEA
jgi:hypothetical protein